MTKLTIVLVDDSPLIRDYLNTTLTRIQGCAVIGTAADGIEAVKVIRELRPHVVVLDITMPHRNGIDVLREIRKEDPNMVIIMFTADPSVVLEDICLKEGANYYLNKSEVLELVAICKDLVTVI
ncbi:MAG TPA: response regulator transcription factor [Pyrinomonadaceae bacterium]|nr:response regulator transcription factor [Pyrinomonadaceae bacterium]